VAIVISTHSEILTLFLFADERILFMWIKHGERVWRKPYVERSDIKITLPSLLKVSVNNITINIGFSSKNSKLKDIIFNVGFNAFTL